jgi:hypothetical protein
VRVRAVALLVIFTVAFATTAPEGSVTTPLIVPVTCCEKSGEERDTNTRETSATHRPLRILASVTRSIFYW